MYTNVEKKAACQLVNVIFCRLKRISRGILTVNFNSGCPPKMYISLRTNFGVVNISMKKMLVLPGSRGVHKSFGA